MTSEFRRIARRSETLHEQVGDSLEDDDKLTRLIEKNPIEAWSGGKGTGGRTFVSYGGTHLQSGFSAPLGCREDFQELLRELVDLRIAEYMDHFVCKVMRASGRLILKLRIRKSTPGVPSGWVDVHVDGQSYVANFVKEFVNVVRLSRDSENNILSEIVRGWFGSDAGRPGTRYEVAFELAGDSLRMEPVLVDKSQPTAQVWRHYMREDIGSLFRLTFNPAIWNQRFVLEGGHVFLLVTFEKGGLNKDHRYEDNVLSSERFQWPSQNRTNQDSKHGQLIRNHQAEGVDIHLLVRRCKVLDGKAAPLVYCGLVDFESWEGEKPISVKWRLREAMPSAR